MIGEREAGLLAFVALEKLERPDRGGDEIAPGALLLDQQDAGARTGR